MHGIPSATATDGRGSAQASLLQEAMLVGSSATIRQSAELGCWYVTIMTLIMLADYLATGGSRVGGKEMPSS